MSQNTEILGASSEELMPYLIFQIVLTSNKLLYGDHTETEMYSAMCFTFPESELAHGENLLRPLIEISIHVET